MAKNAFDELLDSIPEEGHRKALQEIAEANPEVKSGYLRQSDYSRKMDEVRDKTTYAQQWEEWYSKNWVPDAFGDGKGGTRRELEKEQLLRDREKALEQERQRVSELSQKISTGGGEMTLEELNKYIQSNGLVSQTQVDKLLQERGTALVGDVQKQIGGAASLAIQGARLVFRHGKEFDEELDFDKVCDYALENGHADVMKAYDEFVQPKRTERSQKQHQDEIEAAKKTAREEALKERGMAPNAMPDDNSGPAMGPMQRRVMGVQQGADGRVDLSKVDLGRGVLAQEAARNWDRADQ